MPPFGAGAGVALPPIRELFPEYLLHHNPAFAPALPVPIQAGSLQVEPSSFFPERPRSVLMEPAPPLPMSPRATTDTPSPVHIDSDAPRKHACNHCGKRFNRPSSLQIHMNSHTGATPYSCPYPRCGRTFNVNSNMRRHYRGHTYTESLAFTVVARAVLPLRVGDPDDTLTADPRYELRPRPRAPRMPVPVPPPPYS
ncbi:C2h2 conidiation transcription factor [Mycena indigotica]|uniref:C2h2 conidiation transcription factor n=1 Tax=Mycena indigotica TaxID=2126181 RepID=A0A8H6SFN4_9AGAR|nr:C2h2 conidiation transcription factor [Mycena indigotica]KAF7297492.1 C2h2 conidiation transcription factor [Mycena indigotica]